MGDINQLISALRQSADQIEAEVPLLLLDTARTAKSIIQNRIQETGKDHKGKQLGTYSTKKIPPTFFFKDGKTRPTFIGKGRKSTDQQLRKLAREGKKISYGDFRRIDGKQSNYVDMTFSGKMFIQTGMIEKPGTGNKPTVVVGQTTERSKKVADYNVKRYGNFMQLSESEIDILSGDISAGVGDIINRNLNGI